MGHPQTNGKIERFHAEIERHLAGFEAESSAVSTRCGPAGAGGHVGGPFHAGGPKDAMTRLVEWYDEDRPRMSLNEGEAPSMAYVRKMPAKGQIIIDEQPGVAYEARQGVKDFLNGTAGCGTPAGQSSCGVRQMESRRPAAAGPPYPCRLAGSARQAGRAVAEREARGRPGGQGRAAPSAGGEQMPGKEGSPGASHDGQVRLRGNEHQAEDRSIGRRDPLPSRGDPDTMIVDMATLTRGATPQIGRRRPGHIQKPIRDKLLGSVGACHSRRAIEAKGAGKGNQTQRALQCGACNDGTPAGRPPAAVDGAPRDGGSSAAADWAARAGAAGGGADAGTPLSHTRKAESGAARPPSAGRKRRGPSSRAVLRNRGGMRTAPGGEQQGVRDVFISYASENVGVARELKSGLEKRGVSAWLDESEVGPGDDIPASIRDAVKTSLVFVPILSRDYTRGRKIWPQLELGMYLARGDSMKMVPILYGITHGEAAGRLNMLPNVRMDEWDRSAGQIMDRIAKHAVGLRGAARQDASAPDGGAGGDHAQLLAAASEGAVAGIQQTAMGTKISRKMQVCEVELLLGRRGRAVIVGDKGSGKSVLLCQLYEKIAGERAALFVNCEDLQGIESAEEMGAAVLPDGLDILGTLSLLQRDGRRPVVILDSLDAVGRNERAMRAFKQLLARIWSKEVATVATVRRYDYEYSEIIGATDWGEKYEMPLLTGEEVDCALDRAAVTDATPTERSLAANPLNLHLFLQVADAARGEKRSKISREIDLYDAHWHYHVERAAEPRRIRNALYDIAERMCAERRTAVHIDAAGDRAPVDEALRQGILVRKKYDQAGFFHPAYMDYAMSRSLLARRASLTNLVRRDEYNMFLRPTLALTLEMALLRDEEESPKTLEDMLRSDLKHAWKVLAAQALAGVRDCRHERFGRVGNALTDNDMLQRHFIAELTKQGNLFWLEAWGGTFLARWASAPRNPNAVLMTEYMRAAAAADPGLHGRIFAIARLIADNNTWAVARRKAVEALSGINAAGKAEWLEKMSRHAEPHVRTGVMHNIEALLARDREAVPRIFANLFTYEETSAEKTILAQHGQLNLVSNRMQDNYLIRYEMCSLFPRILEANAPTAARAAILVHERNHAPGRGAGQEALVDDGGFDWSRLGVSDGGEADEKSLAASLAAHLGRCGSAEFRELVPLLGGTRIATFRSMLIDGMSQRKADYMEELAGALSDPSTYEAQTLHGSAKNAIKEVSSLLPDADLDRILAAVMSSNPPADGSGEGLRRSEAVRAAFLGQFPQERLGPDHLALVKRRAEKRPRAPSFPASLVFKEMGEPRSPPSGGAGAGMRHGEQGADAMIARLETVSGRLGARPGAVDGANLDEIERLLIECKDDPDPAASVEDERGSPMLVLPSVRGMAAACLARLLSHRKSRRAAAALAELSDDPVNLVRGDVSHALGRLLRADRSLALRIALKYSRDPDPRPRYFLHGAIPGIAAASPPDASAVIRNMLSRGGGDARILAAAIAWLALERRDPLALEMLGKMADGKEFAEPLRAAVPHALQGRLAGQEGRDEALDLLYRMLRNDASPAVRQKAALFALSWLDKADGPDGPKLAQKCMPHLKLMASMMAKPPFDSVIAGSMVGFLERHWSAVPRTALLCLEAVAGDAGGRAVAQPALADASARVLAGLLQHHTMSDGDWRRCVDILDAYAAIGWPAAVKLLSEMERPG